MFRAKVGVSIRALVCQIMSQYPFRLVLGGTIGRTSVFVVKVTKELDVTVPFPVIVTEL